MKKNSEYRDMAAKAMSGNWVTGAVATLVYILISIALDFILGEKWGLVAPLLLLPMGWGLTVMFLSVIRGHKPEYTTLLDGYKGENLGRVWGTILLQMLYTMLWTLLFIVPGIIKSYSYAMVPYVLRDNTELKFNAAIERSMAMMQGHKMQLFLLQLSFIGWIILSILTLGIGYFFLLPYMQTAIAAFYEDVKE